MTGTIFEELVSEIPNCDEKSFKPERIEGKIRSRLKTPLKKVGLKLEEVHVSDTTMPAECYLSISAPFELFKVPFECRVNDLALCDYTEGSKATEFDDSVWKSLSGIISYEDVDGWVPFVEVPVHEQGLVEPYLKWVPSDRLQMNFHFNL